MIDDAFHEIWWIYAQEKHSWGGLRLAHFRKTVDGTIVVTISNETDKRRIGLRIWDDVERNEAWVKVKQIHFPTRAEIEAAVEAKLRQIAKSVTNEVLGE